MSKHVTVILPIAYRGGSLRVTKTIARMVRLGSAQAGVACDVTIAVPEGRYEVAEEFDQEIRDGITISEFSWSKVSRERVDIANQLQGRSVELFDDLYQMPEDGFRNFADSSLWLLVSDRTDWPLAPVRPYAVFATDYIQRYVPEIFPESEWSRIDSPFIRTVQRADAVITTTPQTRSDTISYAGVPSARVHLAPMDFDPESFDGHDDRFRNERPYIAWPTNTTQHKNHLRAFEALISYWDDLGGQLRLKVTGPNSRWMDPDYKLPKTIEEIEYIRSIRRIVGSSSAIKKNVDFHGEVSDREYAGIISGAAFLWHPTIYDNGTFAIAEAAWLGAPALSSGYPQMRYIGERFKIPMKFFNARSREDMARSLLAMEKDAQDLRPRLPSRESLGSHSWKQYAGEYWEMLERIGA